MNSLYIWISLLLVFLGMILGWKKSLGWNPQWSTLVGGVTKENHGGHKRMGFFEQDLAWFDIEKLFFSATNWIPVKMRMIEPSWRCHGTGAYSQRIPKDTEFGLRHPGMLAVPVEYNMTDLIGKCASGAALATNHNKSQAEWSHYSTMNCHGYWFSHHISR